MMQRLNAGETPCSLAPSLSYPPHPTPHTPHPTPEEVVWFPALVL
ncbi:MULTISPECIES: hypothetical protein [unclassified Moorena]|nr:MULTISPECIES: hypothetical protein [unclassified Moorena]